MEIIRTIKEIAEIVAEQYKQSDYGEGEEEYAGLCDFVRLCADEDHISSREAAVFRECIHKWAEENKDTLDIYYDMADKVNMEYVARDGVIGYFYWAPGDKESRQNYLDLFNT